MAHEAVRPYVGSVRRTPGNMNGLQGLPLVVLGYDDWPRTTHELLSLMLRAPARTLHLLRSRAYPRVLVLEYALSSTSSVRTLAGIVPPTVAIVTAIGHAHIERFGSVEGVIADKSALVEAAPPDGLVLLGADNEHAASLDRLSRAPVRKLPGRGRELAQGVARAVGEYLGVPAEAMERALAAPVRIHGRQDLAVCGPLRVLDDAFNANPLSMAYGLETLATQARPGERRVAILGGMGELGRESERLHRATAEVARQRADVVVGVGELARQYALECWYADVATCVAALSGILRSGDFVLVKGSASVGLSGVAEAVRAIGATMEAASATAAPGG
ncbi:MAG TPA: Mur ligase family protein [Gemmatimonadaceae bacterium]|nr:Mur ligase family protein [Gemmatimonadaceae bacterium]